VKVRETSNNTSGMVEIHGKDDKKTSSSKEAGFQNQLRRVEGRNYEDRLNELLNKITQQSGKLSEKVDIKELKIYKKLISEFLDEAVSNSHKFSKQSFLDRRGRHRVFAVVKKINEELELLTKDVLNGEKDNIKILQRLDDIRGLILDIIM